MRKRFGIGVLFVLALAVGLAGSVLAQESAPAPQEGCPFGEACSGYRQGGYGMRGHGYGGTLPGLLAEALGMTEEELYAAQTSGQTVAEIAATRGIDLADVVAAVVAPRAERLAQSVADGYLTQEQADAMLAAMAEQMTWRLENLGIGSGGGCGRWGSGGNGPSDETGTYGGRGRRGGMGGGRWSAPQAPDTDVSASSL
jgi:hypothetical protein